MSNKVLNNKTIIVASHNDGKISEFKSLFMKYNVKIRSLSEIGVKEIEETGKTFKENALIKVKGTPGNFIILSDDSGLCIKALGNKPGIFSARFAKECGGWFEAMKMLYNNLKKKNNSREATFHCVLALKFNDNHILTFSGSVEGQIVWPPRGKNGFGYDPFFVPCDSTQTFAEMNHEDKILIDHRYKAFKKMAKLYLIDS